MFATTLYSTKFKNIDGLYTGLTIGIHSVINSGIRIKFSGIPNRNQHMFLEFLIIKKYIPY
jgi:hypothetical protein